MSPPFSIPPSPSAPVPPTLLQPPGLYRTVLSNGITLVVLENPLADIVAARLLMASGYSLETPANTGLMSFLMALLTKGTSRLTAAAIAETVESVGAHLSTDAAADYSVISLKTVSADFEAMFSLATEVLRDPSFPEAEIDLERRLTLQYLRSLREQPFTVAFNQLRQQIYGDHPYGLAGLGTEASLVALQRPDLVAWHRQQVRPDNLVITMVGRIDAEAAVALVERTLGDWCCPQSPRPQVSFPPMSPGCPWAVVPQATQQSVVMVGYGAAPVQDPSFAPLKLLNTHLGNGLSSRLFVELREKRGLAYDVSALYPTRLGRSQFVAYIGTAPENTATALQGLRQELDRLRHHPLTEGELQTAKNKLLGQYALGKQTNAQMAQLLGWYEVLGLGIGFDQRFQDQVAAVTVADTTAAAQIWFEQPFVTLLGPEAVVMAVEQTDGEGADHGEDCGN